MLMKKRAWLLPRWICLLAAFLPAAAGAQSVFTQRPDDPHAVVLAARGDGAADDSDALQQAIDRVQETVHHGLVLVPEGRYRLTRTIHVWAGIRLIGYGARRPVFVLAPHTPGFQQGEDRCMLWFTDERTPPGEPIADASEFTFFSALSNIDFEIGEANAAAVAIRFNVAQHSYVAHADFHLGSARAAMEHVGNQASDIRVEGGQFGIVTGKTSPAWQFLLMDSTFTGQRVAAIRTHEAGFTLVRDSFADVPVALDIPEGEVEQLYGRDLRMRNIAEAVLKTGDTRNLRSEIVLENVACSHVGTFAAGAEANVPAAGTYFREARYSLGLEIGPDGRERGIALHHHEQVLPSEARAVPSDIPALPPMSGWTSVRSLGARGDGGSDDTAALQQAIDTHRVLYLPSGFYRLSASLRLRPDTVLIGLSPFTTQLILADNDPGFQGSGPAIPLLVAPRGGTDIVTGIGIATGNANPRAAGVEWKAGARSMLEDVDFWRGHSEYVPALEPAAPRPLPRGQRAPIQLDAQYPSLWVHDGGGGVLRGIWSHGGTARAGLLIENTETPGRIYQFSCEHHLRDEVRIDHAAHWQIYDLQTEEENPEGADAVAVELNAARDILFANTYMYRVSRNVMPKLYAVTANDSDGVEFRNVKVFSQTRLAFDNTVHDEGSGVDVRAHHFVHFALTREVHRGAPLPLTFAPGAELTRLATGFSNASGLTADDSGTVYFSDAALHRIYRLDAEQRKAVLLAQEEGSPMVLGFVAPSTLLAVNNEKSVIAVDTKSGAVAAVPAEPKAKPGTKLLLSVGLHNEFVQLQWLLEHRGYIYRVGSNTALRSALLPQERNFYYAPGSTTAMMAGGTWRPLLQSSQLAALAVGERALMVSEEDERAWRVQLRSFAASSTEPLEASLFAERGGTSIVEDDAGNVYIAGGQVYIYDRQGRQTGVLEVPERPESLCLGGRDRHTLFIGARSSVYAMELAAPGK